MAPSVQDHRAFATPITSSTAMISDCHLEMIGISAKVDTPNITQAIAMSYFWDRKDRRLVFLVAIFLVSYIEISVDLNGDCRASLGANGLCQKELLYVVIRISLRISLKRLESFWFGLSIGVEMIDGFVIQLIDCDPNSIIQVLLDLAASEVYRACDARRL